nr:MULTISPECIES: biopolymer transporter ExbD [unclassified Oceanispirochaeta]
MAALNDLSFLLIIYFLVIAGFNTNFGFLLNLPSTDKPLIIQREDLLKVSLDASGALYYGEQVLNGEDLEVLVTENLKSHPNLTLSLKIHPETEYQNFVSTIELIRKLKVENFSFSTMKEGVQSD